VKWLGGGIAIGAAMAVAIMVAGRQPASGEDGGVRSANPSSSRTPTSRAIYSPDISGDPYVIDQQRKVVEALELQCRHFGDHCDEARKAREWMNNRDAR